MGIDCIEQAKKPNKFQMQGARIWLPLDVLQGAAYTNLKPTAKALLLDLAAQLRGGKKGITNNGDLTIDMKVLNKYGWENDKTSVSMIRKMLH